MEIRIHLRHPWLTLLCISVFVLWWSGFISLNISRNTTDQRGMGGIPASLVAAHAVTDINREKIKQAVLERREETLRYTLQIAEGQALEAKDADAVRRANDERAVLLSIIKQREASEKFLLQSLQQLWEAEGSAFTFQDMHTSTKLLWPISPRLGISAHFDDDNYEERFGFPHHAIDIPAPQGTEIQAPADGTVLTVSLNGLGYSYLVVEHEDEVQTVYGHISKSLVQVGDRVSAGQAIALTGGAPGSEGAGLMTTGPHLHFAVKVKGILVDPLKYVPKI